LPLLLPLLLLLQWFENGLDLVAKLMEGNFVSLGSFVVRKAEQNERQMGKEKSKLRPSEQFQSSLASL